MRINLRITLCSTVISLFIVISRENRGSLA